MLIEVVKKATHNNGFGVIILIRLKTKRSGINQPLLCLWKYTKNISQLK